MSFDINTTTICGRLTRDPDFSIVQSNMPLCKFSIANNQGKDKQGNEIVNFLNVTAWGKTAELCNQYIKKGSQVAISGQLKQNRYQDKDGQNKSTVEINAKQVQFIGGKQENNQQSFQQQNNNDSFGSSGFPVGDSTGAFGSGKTAF